MGDLVEEAKAQAMELSSRDSYSADLMDRCADRIEELEHAPDPELIARAREAYYGGDSSNISDALRDLLHALTGGDDE